VDLEREVLELARGRLHRILGEQKPQVVVAGLADVGDRKLRAPPPMRVVTLSTRAAHEDESADEVLQRVQAALDLAAADCRELDVV
jgi:hypothetical protein